MLLNQNEQSLCVVQLDPLRTIPVCRQRRELRMYMSGDLATRSHPLSS